MTCLEEGRLPRRRVLTLVGSAAVGGIAGCVGEKDADPEGTAADPDDDTHPYAVFVDHPGDEPIEFDYGQSCPVCNMSPLDYPNWQCQLAHENGDGAVFDTPGCLFAYYAVPPTDSPVVGAWVTDTATGDLVDGTEAVYVLVTTSPNPADEPMDPNPRPFGDREDALAFLAEWDLEELTEDDVVGLEDVDYETAAIYRGYRMPDP